MFRVRTRKYGYILDYQRKFGCYTALKSGYPLFARFIEFLKIRQSIYSFHLYAFHVIIDKALTGHSLNIYSAYA